MKKIITNAWHAAEARRAAKQESARLERELAGYASPTERLDLGAALDRYSDEDTHQLRRHLAVPAA